MARTSGRARITAVAVRRGALAALRLVVAGALVAASAHDAAAGFDAGRLWRISRPGVPDSYVLGTIHVADPRVSAIAPPVAEALAKTRSLAMEIVPGPVFADELDGLETLENGARLKPLIGSDAYARLRVELMIQGLKEETIERLKPWAALLRITRPEAASGVRSLDENLFVAARARRMRVYSLEAAEEQAASFDTIPVDTQVALLDRALSRRDSPLAVSEPAIDAWLRGDLRGLDRLPAKAGEREPAMRVHYERLVRHIIRDRTALLHHRLFMPLRSGGVFVAIGASHLPGNDGLLAMLSRDGYRITRVW